MDSLVDNPYQNINFTPSPNFKKLDQSLDSFTEKLSPEQLIDFKHSNVKIDTIFEHESSKVI